MKNKKSVKKKVQKSEKTCCETENGCSKFPGLTNFEIDARDSYEKVIAHIKKLEQREEKNEKHIRWTTTELNKSSRHIKNLETTLLKSREAIQEMLIGLGCSPFSKFSLSKVAVSALRINPDNPCFFGLSSRKLYLYSEKESALYLWAAFKLNFGNFAWLTP